MGDDDCPWKQDDGLVRVPTVLPDYNRPISEHPKPLTKKPDRRAMNREQGKQYLLDFKIPFTIHGNGVHLIVEGKDCHIDFWPGSGRWATRNSRRMWGFGVRQLVEFITGRPVT